MQKKEQKEKKASSGKSRKICRNVLSAVKYVVLTCAAFAIIWLVIMLVQINRPTNQVTPRSDQPLLPQMNEVVSSSEGDMTPLAASFPVPVMMLMPGTSSASFTRGTVSSFPVSDVSSGFGRKFHVEYDVSSFTLLLDSIYPATASSEIDVSSFTLTGDSSFTIAGIPASKWTSGKGTMLTCQSEDAIYTLTWLSPEPLPQGVIQSVQLFE